jgi:hypothetical protein
MAGCLSADASIAEGSYKAMGQSAQNASESQRQKRGKEWQNYGAEPKKN